MLNFEYYFSNRTTQALAAIDLAVETKTDVQVQKLSGEVMFKLFLFSIPGLAIGIKIKKK
jgi:hypothetical protein